MKLSKTEKEITKEKIIILVKGGKISTEKVINDVYRMVQPLIPHCNKYNVSGCVSALAEKNVIRCHGGFCW